MRATATPDQGCQHIEDQHFASRACMIHEYGIHEALLSRTCASSIYGIPVLSLDL